MMRHENPFYLSGMGRTGSSVPSVDVRNSGRVQQSKYNRQITDGLLGELDFQMDGLQPACDVVVVFAQFASMPKDI